MAQNMAQPRTPMQERLSMLQARIGNLRQNARFSPTSSNTMSASQTRRIAGDSTVQSQQQLQHQQQQREWATSSANMISNFGQQYQNAGLSSSETPAPGPVGVTSSELQGQQNSLLPASASNHDPEQEKLDNEMRELRARREKLLFELSEIDEKEKQLKRRGESTPGYQRPLGRPEYSSGQIIRAPAIDDDEPMEPLQLSLNFDPRTIEPPNDASPKPPPTFSTPQRGLVQLENAPVEEPDQPRAIVANGNNGNVNALAAERIDFMKKWNQIDTEGDPRLVGASQFSSRGTAGSSSVRTISEEQRRTAQPSAAFDFGTPSGSGRQTVLRPPVQVFDDGTPEIAQPNPRTNRPFDDTNEFARQLTAPQKEIRQPSRTEELGETPQGSGPLDVSGFIKAWGDVCSAEGGSDNRPTQQQIQQKQIVPQLAPSVVDQENNSDERLTTRAFGTSNNTVPISSSNTSIHPLPLSSGGVIPPELPTLDLTGYLTKHVMTDSGYETARRFFHLMDHRGSARLVWAPSPVVQSTGGFSLNHVLRCQTFREFIAEGRYPTPPVNSNNCLVFWTPKRTLVIEFPGPMELRRWTEAIQSCGLFVEGSNTNNMNGHGVGAAKAGYNM